MSHLAKDRIGEIRRSLAARFGPALLPGALVLFSIWAVGIGLVTLSSVDPVHTDSTADVLVANATRDRVSPYEDLRVLSERYDIPYLAPTPSGDEADLVHPRTPAALLLLQPLVGLSADTAYRLAVVAALLSVGGLGIWVMPRLTGWPVWVSLAAASVLLFSGPVLRGLQFGSLSALVALLLGVFWAASKDRDSSLGGLFLGVAMALRLFPALLILPALLFDKRRAVGSAVIVAGGLNVVGLLAFGLSLQEVHGGFEAASSTWIGHTANGSILAPVMRWSEVSTVLGVASVASIVAGLVWLAHRSGAGYSTCVAIASAGVLLASPLSWEHYDVLLILVAAVFLKKEGPRILRWSAWIWVGLVTVGYFVRQPWEQAGTIGSGLASLVGRVLLLAALTLAVFQLRHRARWDTVAGAPGHSRAP